MQIRDEKRQDWPQVNELLIAAFQNDAEAKLVTRLRETATPLISLIAEERHEILGYILFTPVTLGERSDLLMGLAPMAVTPARQRQGVGTSLVTKGLQKCRSSGAKAVFVLGHAAYYPRFGFTPTAPHGIVSEYDVPADHFMLLSFDPGQTSIPKGTVRYHREFACH